MASPQSRIVATVQEKPRTVCAISELPNSLDLNIHITSGGRAYQGNTLYDLVAVSDEAAFEECDRHVTIHNSPKSEEVNGITHILKFRNRKPESKQQVTTGIKRDNQFVPILFRVCGNLTRDRYLVSGDCKDDIRNLASYDPSQGQLRFMLVASRSGTSFPQDAEHPSNVLELPFTNFTITMIWSFLNRPSHEQAIDFFLETRKEAGPIRGFEWWEIYNLYTDLYMLHASNYFAVYPERAK